MALNWEMVEHGFSTAGPTYYKASVGGGNLLIVAQISETVYTATVCEPVSGRMIHSFGDFFDGLEDAKRQLATLVPTWQATGK